MKAEPLPKSTEHSSAVGEKKIDFKAWFDRLGLHGKLLAGGAVLGVICAFLPLISISEGGITFSAMVIDYWMGTISFMAYIACGVAAWLLYQSQPSSMQRQFTLGMIGAAGLIALLAAIMLIKARIGIGFGAVLNILAAGGVAAGAYLKAKEAKVI